MKKHKLRNILIVTGLAVAVLSWALHQYPLQTVKSASLPTATHQTPPTLSVPELFALTNAERARAGVPALVLDERLNRSAAAKCQDMATHGYWAHNNPNGTTWESFILAQVDYRGAGENLANGMNTAAKVTKAWMDSPTHKANILNGTYDDIGYAICDSPTRKHLVVQHFTDVR